MQHGLVSSKFPRKTGDTRRSASLGPSDSNKLGQFLYRIIKHTQFLIVRLTSENHASMLSNRTIPVQLSLKIYPIISAPLQLSSSTWERGYKCSWCLSSTLSNLHYLHTCTHMVRPHLRMRGMIWIHIPSILDKLLIPKITSLKV